MGSVDTEVLQDIVAGVSPGSVHEGRWETLAGGENSSVGVVGESIL